MNVQALRTPEESTRFTILMIVSVLAWAGLILGTLGIGLIFVAMGALFVVFIQAALIAHVKGNAVKVTEKQFPEIHARVVELSKQMGLPAAPAVYVLQEGGLLNAFATRFLFRDFVILLSDLLEACPPGPEGSLGKEAEMILAHELGHVALGHVKWMPFLIPGYVIPLLGAAYSRAKERSCDRIGLEACGDLNAAVRGMTILAAGAKYGARVDPAEFVKQQQDLTGFWTSLMELAYTHPFLAKRVAALMNAKNPGSAPVVGRNPLAYLFAPFAGASAAGGSSILIVVAVIGMLAAIAIPRFAQMKQRAAMAKMAAEQRATEAEEARQAAVATEEAGQITAPAVAAMESPAANPVAETTAISADDATVTAAKTMLATVYQVAQQKKTTSGKWPCSEADLGLPPAVHDTLTKAGYELVVNCIDNVVGVAFQNEGKRRILVQPSAGGPPRLTP